MLKLKKMAFVSTCYSIGIEKVYKTYFNYNYQLSVLND